MRRVKILGSIVFVLIVSNSAALLGAGNLAGKWSVRWQNNPNNENPMSLGLHEGRISGTYINDDKASCAVTGNIREQTREFSLTIVCPKWDIRMQGIVTIDGKNAAGGYQAYVKNQGVFTMRKT